MCGGRGLCKRYVRACRIGYRIGYTTARRLSAEGRRAAPPRPRRVPAVGVKWRGGGGGKPRVIPGHAPQPAPTFLPGAGAARPSPREREPEAEGTEGDDVRAPGGGCPQELRPTGGEAGGRPRRSSTRAPGSRPAAGQHVLSPWAGGRGSPRDNDKPLQSLISRKKGSVFLISWH